MRRSGIAMVCVIAGSLAACVNPVKQMACLDSPTRMLVASSMSVTGYRCRPANNHCEQGFVQSEHRGTECESKPGCAFYAERCFCPPGAICVCAGGAPPTCRPAE